ncbi:MAG: TonB-dependent receptor [Chitinophagaceae bacterium]
MKDHRSHYITSILLLVLAGSINAQETDSTRVSRSAGKDSLRQSQGLTGSKKDSIPFSQLKPGPGKDSTLLLQQVIISGAGKRNAFVTGIPSQSIDRRTLSQLNVPSVADAAKYFSGVLVKDYGGAGGLKTVSVRSLGASHTGVLYDGVPVNDLQTGQVDLGRYSANFIQSLDLFQANTNIIPASARSFASASLLTMQSKSFSTLNNKAEWFAGLRQGSFGFWQPQAGIAMPLKRNFFASISTELTHSKGDYPIYIENGVLSHKSKRINSDLDSWQTEVNLLKQFGDSSTLQVKVFNYHSERGLPGSLLLYNQQSNQRLLNSDQFAQARYIKKFAHEWSLLVAGKYNFSYNKYTDPDFSNNAGGLDNRYRQTEYYLSAATSKSFNWLDVSVASDIAYTTLRSNLFNFVFPRRTSTWNNLGVNFYKGAWKLNGSLLLTGIHDDTRTGSNAAHLHKLTPTLAAAFTPGKTGPFLIRTFYKEVFRMPTFNDLYYMLVGNRDLRPEHARQADLGLAFSKGSDNAVRSIRFSADIYYNSIRDKIIAVPGQNLFVWTMLNIGKVDIKGADLTAEVNGTAGNTITWFTRIAYTYQQAKDLTDKSAANYGDRIPYTPDHSGSGLISLTWRQWTAGTSLLFSGLRYSIGDNSPYTQLGGWGTQDVFISRGFNTRLFRINLRAELDNISDERYDVIRSYPMPGRSYKISLILLNQ